MQTNERYFDIFGQAKTPIISNADERISYRMKTTDNFHNTVEQTLLA